MVQPIPASPSLAAAFVACWPGWTRTAIPSKRTIVDIGTNDRATRYEITKFRNELDSGDARQSITTRTVAAHKYGVMQLLQLRTNADLVKYAVKHNHLDLARTPETDLPQAPYFQRRGCAGLFLFSPRKNGEITGFETDSITTCSLKLSAKCASLWYTFGTFDNYGC